MADDNRIRVTVGLLVRLEAKPGKEEDLASLLRSALPMVEEEPDTVSWFALRFGPSSFGIFDAFPDQEGREDHLGGRVAAALAENAQELLAKPPVIEKVDVLESKLPQAALGRESSAA